MQKKSPRAVFAKPFLKDSRKVTPESSDRTEATRRLGRPETVTRSSLMVQRFSPYAKTLRFFGCFFILNFGDQSLAKARVAWRSPYTLYAISWIAVILGVPVWLKTKKTDPQDVDKMFTNSLLTSVQWCWIITSAVNLLCMVFGSTRLLQVFRKAALFESSSGIDRLRKSVVTGMRFRMFRKAGITISAGITLGSCLFLTIEDSLKDREKTCSSVLPKMLLRFLCQVVFAFYEGLMYITVSNVCEVFVVYVTAQEVALLNSHCLLRKGRIDESSASLMTEGIRKNMSTVRMLKARFNDIWAPAIVASTVCFIWVHCITWYCLFTNDAQDKYLWLGLAYSGYNTLRFLDLAAIGQHLSGEARNIQNAAIKATFSQAANNYIQQMQFLHDSIDPKAMRLSGAEFFYLDKSLLISIAGSVITYTVILVQTNDDISSRTGSGMVNTRT